MRLLTKTTFAALLLGTSLAAPVLADNAATAGCGMAAHRTDAEGGGWQPAPGTAVRRTDAEGGGWQPAPGSARRTEADGAGVASGNQSTKLAEAAPCK